MTSSRSTVGSTLGAAVVLIALLISGAPSSAQSNSAEPTVFATCLDLEIDSPISLFATCKVVDDANQIFYEQPVQITVGPIHRLSEQRLNAAIAEELARTLVDAGPNVVPGLTREGLYFHALAKAR